MSATKLTQEEYIKMFGLVCPFCGEQEAKTSAKWPDPPVAGTVTWDASCGACGKKWVDVFELERFQF